MCQSQTSKPRLAPCEGSLVYKDKGQLVTARYLMPPQTYFGYLKLCVTTERLRTLQSNSQPGWRLEGSAMEMRLKGEDLTAISSPASVQHLSASEPRYARHYTTGSVLFLTGFSWRIYLFVSLLRMLLYWKATLLRIWHVVIKNLFKKNKTIKQKKNECNICNRIRVNTSVKYESTPQYNMNLWHKIHRKIRKAYFLLCKDLSEDMWPTCS